jgi:membrane-bound metal-dependent hydrolase YbcI (DUF457 family)
VIAGHFGLAAAVKSRVPAAPTWGLMLASVWLDVVFTPLFLTGIETMTPFGAGDGKAYGSAVIHADWTHSLLGALVIAVVFGAVCAIPWGRKLGAVMAAMVFSHWLLDLPMHHHDMPLLPGDAGHLPLMGFGLWSLPALSASLELALVVMGTWSYGRAAIKVCDGGGIERMSAHTAAMAMAAAGVVTLALDVAGL